MFGRNHTSSAERVLMNVIQFLDHHRIVEDGLGMVTFLPDLIAAVRFVRLAKRLESIQKPTPSLATELFQ